MTCVTLTLDARLAVRALTHAVFTVQQVEHARLTCQAIRERGLTIRREVAVEIKHKFRAMMQERFPALAWVSPEQWASGVRPLGWDVPL